MAGAERHHGDAEPSQAFTLEQFVAAQRAGQCLACARPLCQCICLHPSERPPCLEVVA